MPTPPERFLADEMLGRLARWLRFLGYDVERATGIGDSRILARARETQRFLLTRDVQLAERAAKDPGSLLVRSLALEEQVQEVLLGLGLTPEPGKALSRCGRCNGELVLADPAKAREHVPEGVRGRDRFFACTGCGQVYWSGSHAAKIAEKTRRWSERTPS